MSEFLAVAAFLVALAAVWFTSEVLRRMEARINPAKNPYIKTFSTALEQRDRLLKAMEDRLQSLEGQVRAFESEKRAAPERLEREIAAVTTRLKQARRLAPSSPLNG